MTHDSLGTLIQLMASARSDLEREAYAWLARLGRAPNGSWWNGEESLARRRLAGLRLPPESGLPEWFALRLEEASRLRNDPRIFSRRFVEAWHHSAQDAYRAAAALYASLGPGERAALQAWRPHAPTQETPP